MSRLPQKAFMVGLGEVLGRGFAFLSTIYIARILGAEYYGYIVFAISVLGYALWFGDLGIQNLGVREIAKPVKHQRFLARELFITKVVLGVIVMLITLAGTYLFTPPGLKQQLILGYLCSLLPFALLLEWFFNGKQAFGKIVLSKVMMGACYLVLLLLFIQSKEQVELVPYLYTASACLAAITLGVFAFGESEFKLPSQGFRVYSDLMRANIKLGLGLFFTQMPILLPPLLVGTFVSITDNGLYGAAAKIVLIATALDKVLFRLLLPNVASRWANNQEHTRSILPELVTLGSCFGALTALVLALFAKQGMVLLFGMEFEPGYTILQALSIFVFCTFTHSMLSHTLIATAKDNAYVKTTFTGGMIGTIILVLSAFLGDAVIIALAVGIVELVFIGSSLYWFSKEITSVSLYRIMMPLALAIALFFICQTLPFPLWATSLVAVPVLLLSFFMTGILSGRQVELVKRALKT
ncbi:MAG: oligosaccharide flippase family protein [Bacteroidota bacterium]